MKNLISSLEMLCVGALMILFGVMTSMLVAVGGDTYNRIDDKQEVTSNLRIAASYVCMQVRKNETAGSISVFADDEVGDVLHLRNVETGESVYIYLYRDCLYELYAQSFRPDYGEEIITLDDFSVRREDRLLRVDLVIGDTTRSVSLAARSEVGA